MHFLRELILDDSVRSHLRAPLASRPLLGGIQKAGADSPAATLLNNVPAFDVSDRVGRIAAIGVGTETAFQKGDERSILVFSNKNN